MSRRTLPFEGWPAVDRLAVGGCTRGRRPAVGCRRRSALERQELPANRQELRAMDSIPDVGRPARSRGPPAARISEASLLGFVALLRRDGLSSETVFSTVRNLKSALWAMAPDADLLILKRLVARLDRERTPRRHKYRRVEDPRKLLDAGFRYIEARAHSLQPGHSDQLRAGWARSGLMVCVLA